MSMSEQEQQTDIEKSASLTEDQKQGGQGDNEYGSSSVLTDIINPAQYFGVVLQYWWLVLLVVLAGVAASTVYCVLATPLYRASSRFELFREPRLDFARESDRSERRDESSVTQELERQMIIMKSGTLHERVMKSLESEWNDEISSGNLNPKVEVRQVRDSGTMVDLRVDAVNPDYAKAYLDEMLDAYKQLRREEILQSNDQTLANLREEQEDLGRELEAARNALAEFQKEHNITYTQAKAWHDEQFLNNLIQRENSLRMQRTMLESRFNFLEKADAPTIQAALDLTIETQSAADNISPPEDIDFSEYEDQDFSVENRPEYDSDSSQDRQGEVSEIDDAQWSDQSDWQEKQARLLRIESEYEDQSETYREEHPRMIELEKEIEEAERDLRLAGHVSLKQLEARHEAVKIELDAVENAAKTWRKELDLTTDERAEYSQLQAQVEHLKELHNSIHKRIMDSSVVNADAMFSRIIEPIRAGSEPVWPAKAKIVVLAIIASLGIGAGGAFTLDYFDTRFLDVMAIEERLNIPYISGVPDWGRIIRRFDPRKSSIVVSRGEKDTSTETYRALRTGIEYLTEEYPSYALLFTSGEEGEGKTITALNLAILSAWSGKKVLLVDGDLRRGKLHKDFSVKRDPGLCEFFAGEHSDWHKLVHTTEHDGLGFIPCGQYRAEVPEMLSMHRLRNLLKEWKKEYDLILIDSAPVGQIVDTTIFARACDGVLLVVKHGSARFASVRHAVHRLLDANILGFCLNNIQLGQSKYSYYRKYGGYHYGRYAYSYGGYYSGYYSETDKTDKEKEDNTATDTS
ncbi:MAG: polysaccharide biosynthesis tyrosine autokinase [Lentisphaeria bacterium]